MVRTERPDWSKFLELLSAKPSELPGQTIGEAYAEAAIADIAFRACEVYEHTSVERTAWVTQLQALVALLQQHMQMDRCECGEAALEPGSCLCCLTDAVVAEVEQQFGSTEGQQGGGDGACPLSGCQ